MNDGRQWWWSSLPSPSSPRVVAAFIIFGNIILILFLGLSLSPLNPLPLHVQPPNSILLSTVMILPPPLQVVAVGLAPFFSSEEESNVMKEQHQQPQHKSTKEDDDVVIIHTVKGHHGFPSFLDYNPNYLNNTNTNKENEQQEQRNKEVVLTVSYDQRSILLNKTDRVILLGGSIHPSRVSSRTHYNHILDEMVHNGLNLVTLYVMWSDHQPTIHTTSMDKKKTNTNTKNNNNSSNTHTHTNNSNIDWSFPDWSSMSMTMPSSSNITNTKWNLANAIQDAALHGLFVHIRIGPYDCAEYSYGGIPVWLGIQRPNIKFRRPNQDWLESMDFFLSQIIDYINVNKLYAHQGGPIILSQIENELGEGDENKNEKESMLYVDKSSGQFIYPSTNTYTNTNATTTHRDHRHKKKNIRKATIQDYADWCGAIAQKYSGPDVQWTMCNGLTANNTIQTCNAINTGPEWLEQHGGTGRIQIDQPALLTEFEEGFQDWGETPEKPNDYFWGRTAADAAREALRWFARGGTHLNYYMFFGGYNRGRQAAGGITNRYAADAALCPSGERHQPKFNHYQSLHRVIASIAPTLLAAETALGKEKPVEVMTGDDDNNKTWVIGKHQRKFEYIVSDPIATINDQTTTNRKYKQVIFIENDATEKVVVRIPLIALAVIDNVRFTMAPTSAILVVDGILLFDSAAIDPKSMSFERKFATSSSLPPLVGWTSWPEGVGTQRKDPMTVIDTKPVEQTKLNIKSNVWSDYAWYETTIIIEEEGITDYDDVVSLFIESQRSTGLLVFIDDTFVASVEDHSHLFEGSLTMATRISRDHLLPVDVPHKLAILCENFGYSNLIGRFGNSLTGPKLKGITGNVILQVPVRTKIAKMNNISLVDGRREWKSFPGLRGEKNGYMYNMRKDNSNLKKNITIVKPNIRNNNDNHNDTSLSSQKIIPTWTSFLFRTPEYDPITQSLFLKITTGRGHFWLNGNDLGRYWNITQGVGDGDNENEIETKNFDDNNASDRKNKNNYSHYSQEYYFLPIDYLKNDDTLNEVIIFNSMSAGAGQMISAETIKLVLSWITESNEKEFRDEVAYPLACL